MNFQPKLVLCVVRKSEMYKDIETALGDSFSVVPCYNAIDALKKSLNVKFSLFILSDTLNKSIPTTLIGMWHDVEATRTTPIIMLKTEKDNTGKEKMLFSSAMFIIDKVYELDRLQEEAKKMIGATDSPSYDAADMKDFMRSLILALEAKDEYSRNHSARVSVLSSAIAKMMKLPTQDINEIGVAGFFHDIGKIGIPDVVLLKPGKLDADEFHVIQQHPVISERICHPIKNFTPILPIIKSHHERFDGKGYPDGLMGENIPLGARIVAVADTFDALTSNRPYREAFSLEKVKNIMMHGAGQQWDKSIVETFWDNVSNEKIIEILSHSPEQFGTQGQSLLIGTAFLQNQSNPGVPDLGKVSTIENNLTNSAEEAEKAEKFS